VYILVIESSWLLHHRYCCSLVSVDVVTNSDMEMEGYVTVHARQLTACAL